MITIILCNYYIQVENVLSTVEYGLLITAVSVMAGELLCQSDLEL